MSAEGVSRLCQEIGSHYRKVLNKKKIEQNKEKRKKRKKKNKPKLIKNFYKCMSFFPFSFSLFPIPFFPFSFSLFPIPFSHFPLFSYSLILLTEETGVTLAISVSNTLSPFFFFSLLLLVFFWQLCLLRYRLRISALYAKAKNKKNKKIKK
ncbi:predicted protein [Lodderomyces elongisporus NRRL YB-4239]|uniref:Uncharacterized protein n=1 Tax=Lodderomyces elongisporus (strain ATCC 11503 / CBS 2605 / JCM 1781 / NBRC 1676 / NRRL YB-4239) TaxID=379508 RepID=A5DXM4_LODEL|nr:predicted protein [Lodderomyces elongisporus NRRL YB-4239]